MRCLVLVTIALLINLAYSQYPEPPPLSPKSCRDAKSDCSTYIYQDCRGKTKAWGLQSCPKFCGYCGVGCIDRIQDCPNYGRAACDKYPGWAEYNCAKTCDYCYTYKPPRWTDATCNDAITNCADYTGKVCLNKAVGPWVDTNCPRYCGRCGCKDQLPNCVEYGKSVCTGAHRLWAIANCASFCQVCSLRTQEVVEISKLLPPPVLAKPTLDPASSGLCEDRLINCGAYGADACSNFPLWAENKCQKTCGYCGCQDKRSDCASYGPEACRAPYLDWALDNCARTCRVCGTVKALQDRTASSACFDSSPSCDKNPDPWCDQQPTTAWATCGKTCRFCECADKNSLCPFYETPAICQYDYGKVNCKKTCGLCRKKNDTATYPIPPLLTNVPRVIQGRWAADTVTQTNPTCSDALGSCDQFKATICQGQLAIKKTNCAKTCGVCDVCEHKKTGRAAGETWSDGCGVTCSCAPDGKVTCRNTCPVWDVKFGCQLQDAAPGQCCKTLTCPAGVTISPPVPRA